MKKEEILAVIDRAIREKEQVYVTYTCPLTHKETLAILESENHFSICEFGFNGEDTDNLGHYIGITYESVISIVLSTEYKI
jgi:hypothetical protein